MKRLISYLLALVMVLSLLAGGTGSALAAGTVEASDIDLQLSVIFTQLSKLKQEKGENDWFYSVTDLDHDGNLEFVAATFHPQDRSTNLKVWEISEDRKSLNECELNKDEDESFPDIMTDVADAYHNVEADTWVYIFYDNVVISDDEVYTVKTAVNLKNGVISYEPFAIQHTVVSKSNRSVSFTDANGIAISSEQYNAAGSNAFAGTERTSVNFEWLTEDDLGSLTRLIDSYKVFSGEKKPTETFPVPRPAALQDAETTPAPAPTAAPTQEIKFLSVTKNPTNENRKAGDTALFVACANAYESLSWTFVSPYGGEYSVAGFRSLFNASVTGEYSTTLGVNKVTTDMNGWGAYCTFYYKGQTQRTTTAFMYIKGTPAPAPKTGTYYGTVTDWNNDTISVNLDGSMLAVLPRYICSVSGELYAGAPATVYWSEDASRKLTYTSCIITGREPAPEPEGGTFYGTVADWNYGTVTVNLDGTTLAAISWDICTVSGEIYVGAPATVVWQGTTTKGLNYISCSITGREPAPIPVYGSMGGTAHESGGGFTLYLYDGTEVYVDGWKCSVSGVFYEGAPCTAYYTDSPTMETIYRVDIYGSDPYTPEPEPEPAPDPAPDPGPLYGSIDGRAFDNLDGRVVLFLDNGATIYVQRDICNFFGELVVAGAGNPCTAYFINEPTQSGIYSVNVYQAQDPGL